MIYNNNYINNNNIKTNITYYVRLSPEDIISCDTSNNIDIINYMSEIINKFFRNYDYDLAYDYVSPMISFKYKIYTFKIKFNKRYDGKLYWILLL